MNIYTLGKYALTIAILLSGQKTIAQVSSKHWTIKNANEILLDLSDKSNYPYKDNIELSGKRVSGIISYTINDKKEVSISREIFFPQLRTYIGTNDPEWKHYRAYLHDVYSDNILPTIAINDKIYVPGPVKKVVINGMLQFEYEPVNGIGLTRSFFPSMNERMFVEQWILTNTGGTAITLQCSNTYRKKEVNGVKGRYTTIVDSNIPNQIVLEKEESYTFSISISATLNQEKVLTINGGEFFNERMAFLKEMRSSLNLVTPNPTLNTLFEFSKIRGSESIFESKLGLIHSPGGGRYYCGFWANDQAEYIGPFFPYLGYKTGNDASINIYELFSKEINEAYKNIRYSFEMEGDAPINPLDRGDAAMIAYGAAQFALTSGDKKIAETLWPLITWCLEYNRRQLNDAGVVASESDEMEGRIETGTANLSTSSLYYGALELAVSLGRSLKKQKTTLQKYRQQSEVLKNAIDTYFGAEVEGITTYKYYKEHSKLRHWICLPLVVQIFDRKEGTIKALFEKLWSENGVHVEKNDENKAISEIFWDRGTLYALRGTFLAGATGQSIEKLNQFSEKRLLGDRVPYVVEAYPEGGMAHLSAESGLYCRVFIEGMFGIVPTGLKSFKCTPRLPKTWSQMALNNIKAFGEDFNIKIQRVGKKLNVKVVSKDNTVAFNRKINEGDSINIVFKTK